MKTICIWQKTPKLHQVPWGTEETHTLYLGGDWGLESTEGNVALGVALPFHLHPRCLFGVLWRGAGTLCPWWLWGTCPRGKEIRPRKQSCPVQWKRAGSAGHDAGGSWQPVPWQRHVGKHMVSITWKARLLWGIACSWLQETQLVTLFCFSLIGTV